MPDKRKMLTAWGELEFEAARPVGAPAGGVGAAGARAARRADGGARTSRAAQFMPFAALTGYYELAREQERIVEPRHTLTEEEAEGLSRTLMQVRRGDMVRLTFYDWDTYRTRAGVIDQVDTAHRRLILKGSPSTAIPFDDIWKLARGARGD